MCGCPSAHILLFEPIQTVDRTAAAFLIKVLTQQTEVNSDTEHPQTPVQKVDFDSACPMFIQGALHDRKAVGALALYTVPFRDIVGTMTPQPTQRSKPCLTITGPISSN